MVGELRIGFVGFGEAAYNIAKGLKQPGIGPITAFDINARTPKLGDKIQQRARETGTRLAATNEELLRSAEVILSTVTADQAGAAAEQNAPFLNAGHFYADLNSVSPGLKQSIARTIETSGARFVEIAVMAAVPPHGVRVPMLAGGKSAEQFAALLTRFGFSIEVVSTEVGAAAATKMFRSMIVKGLEALLTECVLGASAYGADERVFASLSETFPGINWKELANYMVGRVVEHGERRAREMEEVAETLRSAGVEPIMAEAVVRRMDWAAQLRLKDRFGGGAPKTYQELVDLLAKVSVAAD